MLIDKTSTESSVREQCQFLNLNRSTLYYQAKAPIAETQMLMRLVDEVYTQHPFYGTRRMRAHLKR